SCWSPSRPEPPRPLRGPLRTRRRHPLPPSGDGSPPGSSVRSRSRYRPRVAVWTLTALVFPTVESRSPAQKERRALPSRRSFLTPRFSCFLDPEKLVMLAGYQEEERKKYLTVKGGAS